MRIPNLPARASKVLPGAVAAAALLMAPAPAFAEQTTEPAEPQDGVCQIEDASLQWGVKESFRSYISGSIANGDWETSDGAAYDTPNFSWSDGSGTYDPETGTGDVSFTGTVHFTGHDGVLDLTIANPTVEFEDGEASLLLDTASTDMEGEVAIDEAQQWVAEIAVDQEIPTEDGTVELTELATTLTNSGAAAFAGFYEAGEELDPVNLHFGIAGCADAGGGPVEDSGAQEPAESEQEPMIIPSPEIPWLAIGLGGLALLIIGFTIGIFVGGRRPKTKRRRRAADPNDENHTADDLMGENS